MLWFDFWIPSRIEYDAYRTDLEELNLGPRDATTAPKIEVAQLQFQVHREKYERMRNDVSVKLKFLEENKVGHSVVPLDVPCARVAALGSTLYVPRVLTVSFPFLSPKQVKVLHNQLILFHNAIAAYYAGNQQQQLEQTLKQFHIKLKMPGGDSPSWLEEH